MIAEIRHIDKQHQAIFGFAQAALDDAMERIWFAALEKSCNPGRGCDIGVGGHDLLEMGFLDTQKLTAMGASSSAKTGIWIGFRVTDADTWDRVVKQEIRTFTLDFDPRQGVEVRFEAPQPTQHAFTAAVEKRGNNSMCSETLPASVSKALNSSPERLTRDDFEAALEDLAKSSQQPTETFEQSYARVLASETGVRLYSGYDLAPVAPVPVAKQAEAVNKSWDRIEVAAATIRRNEPSLTKEQSVSRALREQPTLYSDYLSEVESQVETQVTY